MSESGEMPPDPFIPEDLSTFGKGAYSFFVSLVQAGFREDQALDLVKTIILNLLLSGVRAQ